MSDTLTFASPQWLYLILLAVPLIAVKVFSSNASREGLERITSQRLRVHLVTERRPLGDWGRFALQILGLSLIAVALARPQKGFVEEVTRVEGRNIIIAIDTSRSMLAEDISPNSRTSRLTQAKLAAIDLIAELPDDRIGLIAFAGSAFMQAPMTPDHSAVVETIEQLNTFVIERGGTNLAAAIDLARERFGATEAARNALILFTDGDDLEGTALKAAEKAHRENVLIVAIGVGSERGAIVPDPEVKQGRVFLKDNEGELVMSSMDSESLEKIAKATNGRFINLRGGLMNKQLVSDVLANISYSQSEDRMKRTPRERYALPLLLGLGCVAAGFIASAWGSRPAARHALAAILLLMFLPIPELRAAAPGASAYEAFAGGDFEEAKSRYASAGEQAKRRAQRQRLDFGLGTAAYANGDFDEAVDAFASALISSDPSLQERSHYNLGNTLFRKAEKLWKDQENGGMKKLDEVIVEFEDSADHYRSSLEIDAQAEDSQTNLDIVEDLLEQLRKIQQQQQEQQDQEQKEEEEQEQENEEEKKEEEKSEESESEENEEAEQSGESGEEEEEEQGAGEEEDQENSSESQEGEEGEPGEEQQNSEQEAEPGEEETEGSEAGEEGTEQDTPEPAPDPDDEVDESTGYSKNQARENLRELSDEQSDLGLLRRRRLRQVPRSYKDW
ncbi:MAG: VWA domain-containing protein [Verrucomicrobiales bacterium]